MLNRYQASMLLAGVGDAIGYKGGKWEFCHDGEQIHKEVAQMGGVENLHVKLPTFKVSDDTVMLLATSEGVYGTSGILPGLKSESVRTKDQHGEAMRGSEVFTDSTEDQGICSLVSASGKDDNDALFSALAGSYQFCMHDMDGRAPGITTSGVIRLLRPLRKDGHCVPFNLHAGGCGAAMRAMCIGLRYPMPEDINDLVMVSVEAGRMTHHHPTGYLGSLATALLTSYAIQGKPIREWGAGLMSVLPIAKEYVRSAGMFVTENMEKWNYFESAWREYLKFRGISDGQSDPQFTADDDVIKKRDVLWQSWSYSGTGGASGHDAPMIAYDALMQSGSSWIELCKRGMFHGGDSDSTGVVAGAWFGAMYGLQGVPEIHYKNLEYHNRLTTQGKKLLKMTKLKQ